MVGAVHNSQLLNKKAFSVPVRTLFCLRRSSYPSLFLLMIREKWIAGLSFFRLSHEYSAFCGHRVRAALACWNYVVLPLPVCQDTPMSRALNYFYNYYWGCSRKKQTFFSKQLPLDSDSWWCWLFALHCICCSCWVDDILSEILVFCDKSKFHWRISDKLVFR